MTTGIGMGLRGPGFTPVTLVLHLVDCNPKTALGDIKLPRKPVCCVCACLYVHLQAVFIQTCFVGV